MGLADLLARLGALLEPTGSQEACIRAIAKALDANAHTVRAWHFGRYEPRGVGKNLIEQRLRDLIAAAEREGP